MREVTKRDINIIYEEDGLVYGDADGRFYLISGERSFYLSNYPLEPILYIKSPDGTMTTIHQAFSVDELTEAARTNRPLRMITGDEYDIRGVFKLILKAIDSGLDSVDINYAEGLCFMDYLEANGAVSAGTAVNLVKAGMQNPNVMNVFIHSKKVGCTPDGLYYLRRPGTVETDKVAEATDGSMKVFL